MFLELTLHDNTAKLFNKMVNVIETLDKDRLFLSVSETAGCKLEHVSHGA